MNLPSVNPFSSLLKKHQELIKRELYDSPDSNEMGELRDFTDLLRNSGKKIARSNERAQIKEIYRYWLDILFRQEKKSGIHAHYPLEDILPYSGAPVRPKAAFIWLGLLFLSICLFAGISFSFFSRNIDRLNNDESRNGNNPLLPTLMAAASETSFWQKTATPETANLQREIIVPTLTDTYIRTIQPHLSTPLP